MYKLLILQWKEKIRSSFWQKSLILNIILGILSIFLLFYCLALGYFADVIIGKMYQGCNEVVVFTGFLFYYFAIDLIARFLLQQPPIVSIKPYLTLPIKKSLLLNYPLIKSVTSIFNVIPLLLFLPFFVKVICVTYPPLFCLTWIISVLSLIVTNNYLNFSLKKYFSERPYLILLLLALVGIIIYLEIIKVVSISGYFYSVILQLANIPFLFMLPVAVAVLAYSLAYFLLKKNSYIEDKISGKRSQSDRLSFLNRFGVLGNLVRIEVKMILRNKRPKSLLILSVVFLAYGFIFYQKAFLNRPDMLLLAGFIITAMFSLNYGQYLFAWESSYFDSYRANRISIKDYIKSKYLFIGMACILQFIITLPYALISYKIGFINGALLLYNIGISSIVLLFFATFNASYIDLGKSQFMNYQGMGINQFLSIIPIMCFPLLVYILFKYLGIPQFSFYALAIIGLLGILFNKYLLQIIANQFVRRKYKMAMNFKQK